MELSYALDEVEEGSIAVNMLPLLLASRNGAKSKDKIDRWGKERKKESIRLQLKGLVRSLSFW